MDTYRNFIELSKKEVDGVDFRVVILGQPTASTVVVAPHGGGIEPGTSQVAQAIADDNFNLALFEGIKASGNSILHITSTNFDEPQ
jgi:phage replication-related protein YjqB (UPF0714/DUF867 family)